MNPLFRPVVLSLMCCVLGMGCGQTATAPSMPLSQAVEQGNLKAVQQHIAAKSDLNKADGLGLTPLHLAALKGDVAMVQALSKGGADVQRKARNGKTPLDMAREKGQTAVVELLQQRGQKSGGRGLIDGGLGVSEALDNP
jgi:ankyrin repeat protein